MRIFQNPFHSSSSRFSILLVGLLTLFSCTSEIDLEVPLQLTISEGFVNPIGFYDAQPSFSWKLPEGTKAQTAYEITVASSVAQLSNDPDLWSSGKVDSDQSLFVRYQGKELSSRQAAFWKVRFWNEKGESSDWSEVASFELGLLANDDWKGRWISIPASELTEMDSVGRNKGSLLFRPQYFRKEISIGENVKRARLYITAKGVFETYINGQKVSTDAMAPGWTPEKAYLPTLTYDVTDMLKVGDNALGAIVAEGWHSGRINLRSTKKTLEHTPGLLYQLEIETDDGSGMIVSDDSWKVSINGPLRSSKIYDGEIYDANYDLGDWTNPDFDDAKWSIAEEQTLVDSISLLPKRFQTVKDRNELNVSQILNETSERPIFDFGQNNVGVPKVKVPMKKGDTLIIRFSEMLDELGAIYTTNYRSAISTDYYIASADGVIEYKPTFTFHGYRYIELSGFEPNAKPRKDWVTAIVQYTDFEENGTFTSSHDKLNQLQSNIEWGLRSNFFDVPTDCPQRDERLGWTGDAQVIAPTSVFYADMYGFWAGWLESMRAEQFSDGGIPHVIPNVLGNNSSPGWADACVIIPWELYFRTGDKRVLEDNYEMMQQWLSYYETKSDNYIARMFAFGDWLQPYSTEREDPRMTRRGDTPPDFVTTAYYARAVALTMKSAEVLGKTKDVEKLKLLHKAISEAFEKKFFDENGKTTTSKETQTQYLLALHFGLLSEDKIEPAVNNLVRLIDEADGHLGTGFLGTPILPLVLDKYGKTDLMYSILFKETYPSWFYSINQGATTMWERWDSYTNMNGFHKDGMNSFNHYAYGAVGQWMYERVAGIQPASPGYKDIIIAPIPGEPLTSAEANYDSPYGKVSSSWKIEGGQFKLAVTIPPNTIATIVVPGDMSEKLLLDGKQFSDSESVQLILTNENGFELKAQSGTYSFQSKMK